MLWEQEPSNYERYLDRAAIARKHHQISGRLRVGLFESSLRRRPCCNETCTRPIVSVDLEAMDQNGRNVTSKQEHP